MALTRIEKAGWGLADMGIGVFVIVKQLLVLAFLTTVLGVPVGLAGALTTLVLVADIVTDPLIGFASDRTRTRWGRRAPWMAVGALVLAGGIAALFMVPPGLSTMGNLGWVGGFFVLATIGFTMVAIPYGAMAGEMTHHPAERSEMTGWRMAFASIGILVGGAVLPGLATSMGYGMAALIVAPLIVAAIWVSLWLTRHTPREETPTTLGPRDTLRQLSRNRPFMVLVVLYGVMTFAIALITAGLPFAAIYLITDAGGSLLSGTAEALTVLSLLFACFVLGSVLSQAFWVLLSRWIGKSLALVAGLALYVGLLCQIYLSLPTTDITPMAALFVLAGMTNGAYQQIPWALYPDLMDLTRSRTGEAIEGAFSGVWLFGQKVANALAPLALGAGLALAGWIETTGGAAAAQPEAALGALRLAVTLVPAAILAFAALLMLAVFMPAHREAKRHVAA